MSRRASAVPTLIALLVLAHGSGKLLAQGTAAAPQAPAASEASPEPVLTAGNVAAADVDHPAAPAALPEREPGESSVRIVRLSEVRGAAELDRNTGSGFENAFDNLPIVQGNRLATHVGVAEVEFEDNSSLRLTPNTTVEFSHLALSGNGVRLSEIRVERGTVYASLSDRKDNALTVLFGRSKVTLPPSSHIELSVIDSDVRLRVLSGSVAVVYPGGTVNVGKKKMLAFASAEQTTPEVADNKDAGTFDEWDKHAVDYHKVRTSSFNGAGSSYLYGGSDLAYYGSFVNLGGSCGTLWQPYFASAGFDPYANGSWAYYPSAGYSWVSPYPWGWAPFHSGSWQNCGAGGWGWNPGGQWNGLRNAPARLGNSVVPGGHVPGRPISPAPGQNSPVAPRPPAPGGLHPTTVLVNSRPLQVSNFSRGSEDFVFRNGSAGMGVPRQTFGKLNSISALTAQHGAVAQTVNGPVSGAYTGPVAGHSNLQRDSAVTGRAPVMNAARPATENVYRMNQPNAGGSAAPMSQRGNAAPMNQGRSGASFPSTPSAAPASRSVPSAPPSGGAGPRGH